MAAATFRGWKKDTDPIYQRGSTFLTGMNLNPHCVKKMLERKAAEREKASAENVEKPNSPAKTSED
jgi:hypothetical protein